MRRRSRFLFFVIFVAVVLPVVCIEGQQKSESSKPHVVLTELKAPEGDAVADQVAQTLTNTLALIMRLTGSVTVERADFLSPNYSFKTVLGYYHKVEAAVAVYGSVQPTPDGGYLIQVKIWNPEKSKSEPTTYSRTITSILSAFDVADQMSLMVASSVVGKQLEVGTIEVKNTGTLPRFSVYADGQLIGRDATRLRVLTGRHEIIVAKPGPLGDQPVEIFHVEIKANQITVVTLKKPVQPVQVKNRQAPASEKKAALPAHERPQTASSETKPETTGSLRVDSTPPGATVFLDTKVLGTTPLNLYGVPTGKYTLRLSRKYFLPTSQVVEIQPGQTAATKVTLTVDQSDPEITSQLISPGKASTVSLIWTLTQAAFLGSPFLLSSQEGVRQYLSTVLDGSVPASVSILGNISYLRIGDHYAHGKTISQIIDLSGLGLTLGLTAGGAALYLWNPDFSTQPAAANLHSLLNTVLISTYIGTATLSALSDIAFSAGAAAKHNQELIDTVAATGELPKKVNRKVHSLIVEAGGGALARAGYRLAIIPNYLAVSATLGMSVLSYQPFRPAGSLSARFEWTPFGTSTGALRPVVFVSAGGETNIAQWGLTAGGGIGADMLFGAFDLFTRSEYRFGFLNGETDGQLTLGVRF